MDKLKFTLFSIITLSLLGLFGYWSVVTIQSGTEHAVDQKVKQLEQENENLRTELQKLQSEFGSLEAKFGASVSGNSIEKEPETPQVTVYEHQDLIDELQGLADGNILLKSKSSGPRVGTVQRFLNIYNKTSNRVDNDYGPGTTSGVTAFQKDSGLSADGEAGKTTFNKMIDWLKKEE